VVSAREGKIVVSLALGFEIESRGVGIGNKGLGIRLLSKNRPQSHSCQLINRLQKIPAE
jgi:hypothetical protein